MSTAIYPTLAGLQFGIGRSPGFSTLIAGAVSGKEQRLAQWPYPKWNYDLAYEFLRDDTTNNELKQLAGFFLSRQGSFDNFNFLDPDDYQVAGQNFGTGTGSATAFHLARDYQGFREPVYRTRAMVNNPISTPEDFDHPTWSPQEITTVGGFPQVGWRAPDGTLSATYVEETVTNSTHRMYVTVPYTAGTTNCFSLFVKRYAGVANIGIQQTNANGSLYANFNLTAVTQPYKEAVNGSSNVAAGIETWPNGWYRIWVSGIESSTVTLPIGLYIYMLDSGFSGSYVGSTATAVVLWGAQFEPGAVPTEYIPAPKVYRTDWQGTNQLRLSARTNKLLRSQEFDNAAWADINTPIVTANTAVAPDGTVTADTITDDSVSVFEGKRQTIAVPNDFDTWYASIYVKKTTGGTSKTFAINVGFTDGTYKCVNARFNTDTGAVLGGALTWVENISADWWRFVTALSNNGTGNTAAIVEFYPATCAHNTAQDDQVVVGAACVWGAEFQNWRPSPAYIPTTSTEATIVDYTLSAEGLVTFNTAPPSNAALTWWGSFYKRVRFKEDMAEFKKFMKNLWEAKKVSLTTDA